MELSTSVLLYGDSLGNTTLCCPYNVITSPGHILCSSFSGFNQKIVILY